MPILVNPFGRLVAVDDQAQVDDLLSKGFAKATPDQERDYVASKMAIKQQQTEPPITPNASVYLATVSQGGKDGYGIASAALLDQLTKLGVNISPTQTGQKVAVLFHNPYSILRLEAPYRILYTMFESDKLPDDWRDYLEAADKILVPSKWCQKVFKDFGFEAEVVPLGYDDTIFKYQERPDRAANHEPFTFLHYNAFNIRKGFPEVFKAFVKAFDKTEPVKMIFKTTLDQIPLPITPSEYPNIEIIRGKCSTKELAEICHRSDAFVFPSRGEGFGMTPLEAMATGLPTIVPNAHGITEYFNSDYMYEVKVKEKCPALYSRYKDQDVGKMVICDVDHLAKQMRYIYDHQKAAREKGKKAAEYVKQWTYAKSAEKLKLIFEAALKLPITQKPLRNTLTLEQI